MKTHQQYPPQFQTNEEKQAKLSRKRVKAFFVIVLLFILFYAGVGFFNSYEKEPKKQISGSGMIIGKPILIGTITETDSTVEYWFKMPVDIDADNNWDIYVIDMAQDMGFANEMPEKLLVSYTIIPVDEPAMRYQRLFQTVVDSHKIKTEMQFTCIANGYSKSK